MDDSTAPDVEDARRFMASLAEPGLAIPESTHAASGLLH